MLDECFKVVLKLVILFVCFFLQPMQGSPQQSTPRWGRPWGTSSPVTCSAPWPVEGKPVNMKIPLVGATRNKLSKDCTRRGTLSYLHLSHSHECLCSFFPLAAVLAQYGSLKSTSIVTGDVNTFVLVFALPCNHIKTESLNDSDKYSFTAAAFSQHLWCFQEIIFDWSLDFFYVWEAVENFVLLLNLLYFPFTGLLTTC